MAYMQGLQGSACSDYQSFNLPFSELLKPPNLKTPSNSHLSGNLSNSKARYRQRLMLYKGCFSGLYDSIGTLILG